VVASLVAVPMAMVAVPVAASIYGMYRLLRRTDRPTHAVRRLYSPDDRSAVNDMVIKAFIAIYLRLPHTATQRSDVDADALQRSARRAMLPHLPRFVNVRGLRFDATIIYSPGSPTVFNQNVGIAL